jgi:RNA polymerase primary sigma factor
VGREFGVTRERVRQIEAKALEKLREMKIHHQLKEYLH